VITEMWLLVVCTAVLTVLMMRGVLNDIRDRS